MITIVRAAASAVLVLSGAACCCCPPAKAPATAEKPHPIEDKPPASACTEGLSGVLRQEVEGRAHLRAGSLIDNSGGVLGLGSVTVPGGRRFMTLDHAKSDEVSADAISDTIQTKTQIEA